MVVVVVISMPVIRPHTCSPTALLTRAELPTIISSVHLADELVDVRLPVAEVTALHEVLELPCPPATSGVGKLEWPEEVGGLIAMLNNERL